MIYQKLGVKLNSKLDLNTNSKKTVLETADIGAIIKFMLDLRDGKEMLMILII